MRVHTGKTELTCVLLDMCVTYRGEVLGVHYMDTTDNMKNNYLDESDSHAAAGTRILLEMVGCV